MLKQETVAWMLSDVRFEPGIAPSPVNLRALEQQCRARSPQRHPTNICTGLYYADPRGKATLSSSLQRSPSFHDSTRMPSHSKALTVAAYICSLNLFTWGSSWAWSWLCFSLDLPSASLAPGLCMVSSVIKNSKLTFSHILVYPADTGPIFPIYRDHFICHSVH